MSNSPAVTLSLIGVTPTSPATDIVSGSAEPSTMSKSSDPAALASPCTSVGALTATGSTAMVLRTVWPPPVHVRAPNAHSPRGAGWSSASVNFTVKVCSAPGASVNWLGVTTTSMPGTSTLAVYVADASSTFFTRRVTVSVPASLPTAIDAWFRFDALTGVSVSKGGANCTPRLTMYWRYSLAVVG